MSVERAAESFVKRLQFWVMIVLSIGGAGWATAMFASHKASAEDLAALRTSFEHHLADDAAHKAADDQRYNDIQDTLHWMRDQIDRIADSVGATRAPR